MIHGVHPIVVGQGAQDLVHTPPMRHDDGTTPTYLVEDLTVSDDSPDRELASGDAAVDSVNLLVEDASGAGTTETRRLFVPAPVGAGVVVGRRYAAQTVGGSVEVFTAAAAEDFYIDAEAPLSQPYGPDARVRGLELRATLPAEVADDEDLLQEDRRLRVAWTYSLRGVIVVDHVLVDLRRASASSYLGAAEAALREEWPELVQRLRQPTGRLVKACARRIEVHLRNRDIKPANFLAGAQGFEVLLARCVWRFGELGIIPGNLDPDEWLRSVREDFLSLWRAVSGVNAGHGTALTDGDDMAPTGNARNRPRRLAVPK